MYPMKSFVKADIVFYFQLCYMQTGPERDLVFTEGLLCLAEFQKHVRQHLARWDINLSLAHFVLQV